MPPVRNTRKGVTDLTGRENERLKEENAAAIDLAAQQMTMVEDVARRSRGDLIDYTDDARPKVSAIPVVEEPVGPPKKYKVRLLADIDQMTFGKEIFHPAEVSEDGGFRDAYLGGLKTYDFKEGREYLVDEAMYIHLRDLGYVYD